MNIYKTQNGRLGCESRQAPEELYQLFQTMLQGLGQALPQQRSGGGYISGL